MARAKSLIRIIITPEGRKTPLIAHLGTVPQAGGYTLNLRARPKAPARMAKLVIAFGTLRMPTPDDDLAGLGQAADHDPGR